MIVLVSVNDFKKSQPSQNAASLTANNLPQGNTQEKEEGNISVSVRYLSGKSDKNQTAYSISLNNHIVSLDSFNFQKTVTLEKDGKTYFPVSVATEGEGHHRKADLVFKSVGTPLTIVILNLGGIPRREFLF